MTQDNEGNDALDLKLNLLKNFRKQSVNNAWTRPHSRCMVGYIRIIHTLVKYLYIIHPTNSSSQFKGF